ncbi:uncharacterized protein DS421_16g557060 [Arachis hypogaea]|nr:uncharacterized protein DS421_16g557060 [Arachis hypogaea]
MQALATITRTTIPTFFFSACCLPGFFPVTGIVKDTGVGVEIGTITSGSDDDDVVGVGVGESTSRREVQLHGGTRDRLLRALAGTDTSELNIGLFLLGSARNLWASDEASSFGLFIPEMSCIFCRSSLEKDSSTKLESHSNSARSSYCF